jgi:predicted aldo/keto reductase-like oxidoreductase
MLPPSPTTAGIVRKALRAMARPAAVFAALALVSILRTAPPSSKAAAIPTWTLPGGVEYPLMALNTASLSVEQVEQAIRVGVAAGLRNVDFHLGAEREGVARALAALGRDALFLVTKLDKPPADMTDPAEAAALVRTTLDAEYAALGADMIDILLLKDSASCPVMQAQWAALEEYLDSGRTRALGVYNFCEFSVRGSTQPLARRTAAQPPRAHGASPTHVPDC